MTSRMGVGRVWRHQDREGNHVLNGEKVCWWGLPEYRILMFVGIRGVVLAGLRRQGWTARMSPARRPI